MSITTVGLPLSFQLVTSSLIAHWNQFLAINTLEWDSHVKSVKHKAMKILGLRRRNFSGSSQYVKTQAYNSLVRPHVEYASAAWCPFEKQHIKVLEAVQRCAHRRTSRGARGAVAPPTMEITGFFGQNAHDSGNGT